MEQTVWSEEGIHLLINEVKKNAFIWDPCNTAYKNKGKKTLFWIKFAEMFNEEFRHANAAITNSDAMKKWSNLKTYFSQQDQKVRKASRSGVSAEKIEAVEGCWRYYDALRFLKTNFTPLPSVNTFNNRSLANLQEMTEDDGDTDHHDSTCSLSETQEVGLVEILSSSLGDENHPFNKTIPEEGMTASTSPDVTKRPQSQHPQKAKRRPRSEKSEVFGEELLKQCLTNSSKMTKILDEEANPKKAECGNFARHVDDQLNKLNPRLQNKAMQAISSILYEISEEQYEEEKFK